MTRPPEGIYPIPLPTPLPVGEVNAYLITGKVPTLIDPGPLTPEAYATLHTALERLEVGIREIKQVIVTHPHVDHSGLAQTVAEESGAPVLVHQGAVAALTDPIATVQRTVRALMAWGESQGIPPDLLGQVAWGHLRWASLTEPAEAAAALVGGDTVLAGDHRWRVLYTPGHSTGHICLWRESDGTLVSGDHLLPGVLSSPLFEPAEGSSLQQRVRSGAEYVASLTRLALLPVGTVLPGHGPVFDGVTRGFILDRIAMMRKRSETVYGHLRSGPLTLWEITRLLFPRVGADKLIFALSNVAGYLDLLEVYGYIAAQTDGRGVQRYVALEPLAMAGD